MQQLKKILLGTLMGASLAAPGFVQAADKKAPAAPGAPSPEMAAMMEKAKAYMTPGPNHRMLDPLVGNWKASVTSWMKPGDKPQMSQGTSQVAWVLNGHQLHENFKGTMGNEPFEGNSYTTYDNVRQEYQTAWMDSMGTGMLYVTGQYDPASKKLAQSGTMGCPMTGDKNMPYRSDLTIDGPDKHTYTSYTKGPDGKEYKSMEIVYARVK